jgi:hypothetical protein
MVKAFLTSTIIEQCFYRDDIPTTVWSMFIPFTWSSTMYHPPLYNSLLPPYIATFIASALTKPTAIDQYPSVLLIATIP